MIYRAITATQKQRANNLTECRGDHWSSVSTAQVKAKKCVKTKVNSRKFSCTSVVRSDDQWSPLHTVGGVRKVYAQPLVI